MYIGLVYQHYDCYKAIYQTENKEQRSTQSSHQLIGGNYQNCKYFENTIPVGFFSTPIWLAHGQL